jgi:hypothetical protein
MRPHADTSTFDGGLGFPSPDWKKREERRLRNTSIFFLQEVRQHKSKKSDQDTAFASTLLLKYIHALRQFEIEERILQPGIYLHILQRDIDYI